MNTKNTLYEIEKNGKRIPISEKELVRRSEKTGVRKGDIIFAYSYVYVNGEKMTAQNVPVLIPVFERFKQEDYEELEGFDEPATGKTAKLVAFLKEKNSVTESADESKSLQKRIEKIKGENSYKTETVEKLLEKNSAVNAKKQKVEKVFNAGKPSKSEEEEKIEDEFSVGISEELFSETMKEVVTTEVKKPKKMTSSGEEEGAVRKKNAAVAIEEFQAKQKKDNKKLIVLTTIYSVLVVLIISIIVLACQTRLFEDISRKLHKREKTPDAVSMESDQKSEAVGSAENNAIAAQRKMPAANESSASVSATDPVSAATTGSVSGLGIASPSESSKKNVSSGANVPGKNRMGEKASVKNPSKAVTSSEGKNEVIDVRIPKESGAVPVANISVAPNNDKASLKVTKNGSSNTSASSSLKEKTSENLSLQAGSDLKEKQQTSENSAVKEGSFTKADRSTKENLPTKEKLSAKAEVVPQKDLSEYALSKVTAGWKGNLEILLKDRLAGKVLPEKGNLAWGSRVGKSEVGPKGDPQTALLLNGSSEKVTFILDAFPDDDFIINLDFMIENFPSKGHKAKILSACGKVSDDPVSLVLESNRELIGASEGFYKSGDVRYEYIHKTDPFVYSLGIWYHLIVVRKGGQMYFYINGNIISAPFKVSSEKTKTKKISLGGSPISEEYAACRVANFIFAVPKTGK